MPRFAIVDLTDTILGFRSLSQTPEPGTFNTRDKAAVNGEPFLLPVIDEPPPFDPATERRDDLGFIVSMDKVTANWTVTPLTAIEIEKNQDDQAAGVIAERLDGRDLFAITTLMEAMKEMYLELRVLDPGWDLTPETKRKAQKLINALVS